MELLEEHQKRGLEDFELNRLLRKEVKRRKNEEKEYLEEKRKMNLGIPLFDLTEKDE